MTENRFNNQDSKFLENQAPYSGLLNHPETNTGHFHSILFKEPGDQNIRKDDEEPSIFQDLNLDQIVKSITSGWQEYDLRPFFNRMLKDPDAISYRQEIMRDLENKHLMQAINSFSERMRSMHLLLPKTQMYYYRFEKERWFLNAVDAYCEAILHLSQDIIDVDMRSRGMIAFRDYLKQYASSEAFGQITAHVAHLKTMLSAIKYSLLIKDSSVTVQRYDNERDYTAEVEDTFEKFRHRAVKEYLINLSVIGRLNHIEAQILDRVALLYPDAFRDLEIFFLENTDFMDEKISVFDREIHFYVAYLAYIEILKSAKLKFCYPQITQTSKEIYCSETFDLALAVKLINEKKEIVLNDFSLSGPERILVVSGPNQGGKTTYARTFGQLHFLASLGCPVPGTKARLFLCDQLFTHFETEEKINTLRGKLQDDLVRIRQIMDRATPNSLIVVNEIFASTTLEDAVYLSKKIIESISELDSLAVCVTFITELASLNAKTVSIVSMIDPNDPAVRTYKLERRPANGLAYALAIAEKHRVTYTWLKKRILS